MTKEEMKTARNIRIAISRLYLTDYIDAEQFERLVAKWKKRLPNWRDLKIPEQT